MNTEPQTHGDHRFAIGLLTGTFIGAGLAIWFAPRLASEIRGRAIDTAKGLGTLAEERYRELRHRGAEAVGALTRKAQDVRDDVAGAVARGGHEMERVAMAARSDRVDEVRKPSAVASRAETV